MAAERLTMIIHPDSIGTQVKDTSNEVVIEFTESNDYNANRHAAEKWLGENGYVHLGGSDYEKAV